MRGGGDDPESMAADPGASAPSPLRGLWDGADREAEDEDGALWSAVRLIDADDAPGRAPPSRTAALDPDAWAAAESALARPLAAAAEAFARFDERLRAVGPRAPAAVERLAQAAAVGLLRREGSAIAPDRLALWIADRAQAAGDDARDLARGAWAARRLAAAPRALLGDAGARRFLERRQGAAAAGAVADWAAAVRALRGAHRLTQAGFAAAAWRALGLSPPGAVLEAQVVAMALAARAGRGGAPFAPIGSPAGAGGAGQGAEARLRAWLSAVAEGAETARLTVERLAEWEARARAETADLSGRTPPRMIDALARRFAVSAAAAAKTAEVSVSAAARNMALLEARGLAREMTGQGRFRLWSARL